MRIALALHDRLDVNSGGAGVVLNLAEAYQRRGHEVSLVSMETLQGMFNRLPRVRAVLASNGFRLADPLFPLFCAVYFSRHLRGHDVIDASTCDAWLYGRLNGGRTRPLLVTHSHGIEHMLHRADVESAVREGPPLSWKYRLYRGTLKLRASARSLRVADLALFLNRTERDFAVADLGIDPVRAHVVPNGLPRAMLGLAPPAQAGGGQAFRVAQIASYLPRKGTRYGAEALNRFLRRHPGAQMLFLGTGCPPERVLGDFDADVRQRIEVVPRFDRLELPRLLRGCAVKLFPTLAEGFGLGLLEAMACGLAPVTTSTDGPRDIVTHEVDGLIVPPRDAAAIEQALERLFHDRTLLGRLQHAAWQRAQAFDWDSIAAARLELYTEFLRERRAGGAVPRSGSWRSRAAMKTEGRRECRTRL
ncbi:glycosyltransferase family 4 protein [Geminicoccaceae bacterium 1502E]|nr:glycosyltransferase family 4 protein [Geminicoccaceae bacterium 1502E]